MDVRLETSIDAPADKVWGILAHQFPDISEWAAGVAFSREASADEAPDGWALAPTAPVAGRLTNAGLELKEFFTAFDDEARRFTFRASGLPRIIEMSQNTTTVTQTGDGSCTVVFDIHVEMSGPFVVLTPVLKRRLTKGIKPVQEDLKVYAETGEVSAARKARRDEAQ